jgi:vacuolar protein sorting-associated protein 29
MVLVLCLGDLHVPHRAVDLPSKFKSLLAPGKIHQILCTGNLCAESMYDYLRSICSDVVVTQGDFDESTKWPDTAVVSVGGFKIGVCHGHQVIPSGDREALAVLIRRLDIDILVTGHSHTFGAYKHEGCLVINCGSATGSWSQSCPSPTPSFALMDVDGTRATVYMYELLDKDELKVEKVEFTKETSTIT